MTEIKLNRFYNIFKLKFWILPTVFALAFCALHLFGNARQQISFLPEIFMLLLIVFIQILSFPKKISVCDSTVIYTDTQSVRVYCGKNGSRRVKVRYTVTALRDVNFSQNFFEKLFDTGTFTFTGHTEFEAKKHVDKIEPQKIHTITGIRQFSKMRPLLEREIKK